MNSWIRASVRVLFRELVEKLTPVLMGRKKVTLDLILRFS